MSYDERHIHPARIDSLIDALRNSDHAYGVAESLECVFDNAPPFQLPRPPRDDWDYAESVVQLLIADRALCLQAFEDEQHGFLVGIEMAEALVRHHGLGWSCWG